MQLHHIIPTHQLGPDSQWNLVRLTIEEHAKAHELLFENYQHSYDLGASKMIRGQLRAGTLSKNKLSKREEMIKVTALIAKFKES